LFTEVSAAIDEHGWHSADSEVGDGSTGRGDVKINRVVE
jgi:hypothetical protein